MNNRVIKCIFFHVLATFFLFFYGSAWALNWTVNSSVNLEEVYSDNINQDNTDKKSALVTDLSPSLSINGNSAVSTFDLNYRLQTLHNAGGDSGLDINNQLQMNTNYEFVRDKLFIDSSSSISQQNVSNRSTARDNVSGGDSTSVSTFSLSPYWTPHFQGYADGEFRVTYDRVSSDGGSSTLSETDSFSQNINLNSGREFSFISWSLDFNNSYRSNSDSENVQFQDSQAQINYAIGRKFSVFARAGHSNNSFSSNSGSSQNGIFYTFGGQWQPSQRFRLQAGYGNNAFVTVEISPFSRLSWATTYTNNSVGLNTAGNGETWNTALNYTTRRSVWSLSYSEQTVTTQQILLEQQIFTLEDLFGDQFQNVAGSQDVRFNILLPTLTDEVFITKIAALSVSFRTGKSNVSANVSKETREFEQSQNEEEITSISASWNWRFTQRSSFNLSSNWQKTESNGVAAFSDERFEISARATRNILARLNGFINYQYVDQSSDDNLNSYTENRFTAGLSLRF